MHRASDAHPSRTTRSRPCIRFRWCERRLRDQHIRSAGSLIRHRCPAAVSGGGFQRRIPGGRARRGRRRRGRCPRSGRGSPASKAWSTGAASRRRRRGWQGRARCWTGARRCWRGGGIGADSGTSVNSGSGVGIGSGIGSGAGRGLSMELSPGLKKHLDESPAFGTVGHPPARRSGARHRGPGDAGRRRPALLDHRQPPPGQEPDPRPQGHRPRHLPGRPLCVRRGPGHARLTPDPGRTLTDRLSLARTGRPFAEVNPASRRRRRRTSWWSGSRPATSPTASDPVPGTPVQGSDVPGTRHGASAHPAQRPVARGAATSPCAAAPRRRLVPPRPPPPARPCGRARRRVPCPATPRPPAPP